jgi:ABC-2 type transport system ATP-binding protein
MAAPRAVRTDGLGHSYRGREALSGVDLEVRPGEIFGVLGPNGSGKTTLFRVLSTLLRPARGKAGVFGHDVVDARMEVRSRIGVVFQSPGLDGKLSVAENLRHQGHLHGMRGAVLGARIDEMLQGLGLAGRERDRAETLSGGLRRRVDLARGLLHGPELLLLDEPSTGLDPAARREVWTILSRLRERDGVTVLLTTHLMDEAERCDRLALLDGGHLVLTGTPEERKVRIGGDVLALEAREPEPLRPRIEERFGLEVASVDGGLRIEAPEGHALAARLAEAFPGEIDSIRVGRPTLEDVFVHETGHRLSEGEG